MLIWKITDGETECVCQHADWVAVELILTFDIAEDEADDAAFKAALACNGDVIRVGDITITASDE